MNPKPDDEVASGEAGFHGMTGPVDIGGGRKADYRIALSSAPKSLTRDDMQHFPGHDLSSGPVPMTVFNPNDDLPHWM